MESQQVVARLTFFYTDGQQESYVFAESVDSDESWVALQQEWRARLNEPWCLLQLGDETVAINMANVLKVDINPALDSLQGGAGIFPNAQRETALTRSYSRS